MPADESERLAEVISLALLDGDAEERFDRVTRLARRIFDVDVALVTLLDSDRNWFLSKDGTDLSESPRDVSFCGHAIHSDDVFHVSDASADPRFADNPLVVDDPTIRFYAGQPIRGPRGSRLGTLCVIGTRPRELDPIERETLRDLAGVIEDEIASTRAGTTDDLTGLTNRRGFELVAHKLLEVCRRTGRNAALLFIDLDDLKIVNDTFGHGAGDRALIQFSQVLADTYRASDVVARLGGDEFAVLVTGTEVPDAAVDKLHTALAEWNATATEPYALAASVGTATFVPDSDDALETLLRRADVSMYEAKQRD